MKPMGCREQRRERDGEGGSEEKVGVEFEEEGMGWDGEIDEGREERRASPNATSEGRASFGVWAPNPTSGGTRVV